MIAFPILSAITFLPLLGAVLILLSGREHLARWIALATTGATLAVSVPLTWHFDKASSALQFVESADWIPAWNIAYTMGVDKFFDRYEKMKDALKFRNWIRVADESGREVKLDKNGNPGLMADRNRVVRGWFFEAIKDEPFFLNPHCQPKQLSVRRG